MTKRPKEVYGKKLIYHYSAPIMFTLFFSLLSVACFVLSLFMPYIGGEPAFTGMEFIKYVINFFGDELNPVIDHYCTDIVNNVFDGFGLATPIIQMSMFIIVLDMLIMGVFGVVLAIACLILIFSGRLKAWKVPYRCSRGMLYSGFFYYGIIIGINIYAAINGKKTYDLLWDYIFLGTLFVSTLILHIIYLKAFKDHVYVKNERQLNIYIEEYEKEHVVVDTTPIVEEDEVKIEEAPKQPKIVLLPAEDQTEKNDSSDNRKKLPRGLKHIGGHAFSQNTVLEEADIPLGIEVLGPGAFANCVNLKIVHIPESVKKIEYNCFFNCIRLERITYGGSREMWKRIKRGSNWLTAAGTKFVVCRDGALAVNPEK